ncbi:MAG TPA: hypothetical protein VGO22_01690 [Pseudorhizobium sp.]|jgi:hypothetical protein|nr:hypothetical protein [Pseudorhizobium sp.]
MQYLAAILTIGGSLFAALAIFHHGLKSDQGTRSDLLGLLYAVLAIGGTLGGTGLFLHLLSRNP